MTLAEAIQLVKSTLSERRRQGDKTYILPRLISVDELCAVEPWAKFVLAEEVAQQLWVAFIDEEPGSAWDHRSRLILVDDDIAEVLMDLSIHFCPSFFEDMQLLNE